MKSIRYFFFKYMHLKMKPDPIGPGRTKFDEVGAEWKSYLQYLAIHIR